jgi:hypothetical protein
MALKLVSVLRALMAIRLNFLSFWKKLSTRCRRASGTVWRGSRTRGFFARHGRRAARMPTRPPSNGRILASVKTALGNCRRSPPAPCGFTGPSPRRRPGLTQEEEEQHRRDVENHDAFRRREALKTAARPERQFTPEQEARQQLAIANREAFREGEARKSAAAPSNSASARQNKRSNISAPSRASPRSKRNSASATSRTVKDFSKSRVRIRKRSRKARACRGYLSVMRVGQATGLHQPPQVTATESADDGK